MPANNTVMASLQRQNTTQQSMSSSNEKTSHRAAAATKSTKKAQSSTSTMKAVKTSTDAPSRSTCARPNGRVATSTKSQPSSPALFHHVETDGQAQPEKEVSKSSPVLSARLENDRQAQKKKRPIRPGRPKKSTQPDLNPCVKGITVAEPWSERWRKLQEKRERLQRDVYGLQSQLDEDKKETNAVQQACTEEQPKVLDPQQTTQPSKPLEPHPQPLPTQTLCDGQSVPQPTEGPVPHSPISAGSSTPASEEKHEPEHERSTPEHPSSALPTPPPTRPATPTPAAPSSLVLPFEPEVESSQAGKVQAEPQLPTPTVDTPPATPPANGPKDDEDTFRHGRCGTPIPPMEEQAVESFDYAPEGCVEIDGEGDITMAGVPRYLAASFYNSFEVDSEGDITMLEQDPDTTMSDAPPLKQKQQPQRRERAISIASTIDIPRENVGAEYDEPEDGDDWYSKNEQDENFRLHQLEARKYVREQQERHTALGIPATHFERRLRNAFIIEQTKVLNKQLDGFWSAVSRGDVRPELTIAIPVRCVGESHHDFDVRVKSFKERCNGLEKEAVRNPEYIRSQEELKALREKKRKHTAHVMPLSEKDCWDDNIL